MKIKSLIGLFVGVCFLAAAVIGSKVEEVLEAIGEVGWGALLVCIFAVPVVILGSEGWRKLFPRDQRPSFSRNLLATCVGLAVNTLIPLASASGEAAKIALFSFWGRRPQTTLPTIMVDRAMQAVSMLFWGLAGVLTLAAVAPQAAIVGPALVASALMSMGIGAFMAIQINGGFGFLARYAGKLMKKEEEREGLAEDAAEMDEAVRATYRRRGALAISSTLHLLKKFILVGELMLISYLIGHPLEFDEALMIRAIVDAIRMVAFFVPGGLGVQESAFVALGAVFGGDPSDMVAISLVTRIREILPSAPFLIYFQIMNARYITKRQEAEAQQ